MTQTPTREETWELVKETTQGENLRKHMLAVEAAMRAYARHFGEDETLWGIVGLLHDFDYEQHPTLDDHPRLGAPILRERGWPETIIRAILSHGNYDGVPARESRMEKALFAVDELTGLITAVALVRPSKDIRDVKVKSVRKKWKDRRFAAAVNREEIAQGAADLGIDLNEHIRIVLEAMQGVAPELGLAGQGDIAT
ncbi:MAG: HDIG domain-containing protein [Chloroflexi bacterium]|nr:HDIG domain-containing protein [Chloroflexota bacterium]